jgi:2-polyprenyl-6-methoxyphenol hydroxylase-like FAD-dependent oxidoreductase
LICKQAEELGVQINNDSIYGQQINSLGELKLGHECVSLNESTESVKAEVLVTGSTTEKQLTINSSFVVGSDGAASNVRRLINVEMEGEDALQNLISIHFFSIDLAQRLVKSRPGMLYFVFNTKAIGVLVAHDLRLGEFIVQVPTISLYSLLIKEYKSASVYTCLCTNNRYHFFHLSNLTRTLRIT